MRQKAEVEILFGSMCRGDTDHLSDKDILIIEDDYELLGTRKNALTDKGYSVAAYTWKRFLRAVSMKSLFIQHLKQEGTILSDSKGRANKVLANYSPKPSYLDEIKNNENLFSLLETYPCTKQGMLWATDMLYVALRNFGVLHLASQKKYIFSYEQIINKLISNGLAHRRYKNCLLQLRWMKSLYRNNHSIPFHSIKNVIDEATEAISMIYSKPLRPVSPLDCLEELTPYTKPKQSCIYERLRNIEKSYISLTAISPSLTEHEDFQKILKWIQNPRSYAFLASTKEEEIIDIFIKHKTHISSTNGKTLEHGEGLSYQV